MAICPQCHAQFYERTFRAGENAKGVMAEITSNMMDGYKAIQTGVAEGVTHQQLFEAAVGTLSIVAKEVPELQAGVQFKTDSAAAHKYAHATNCHGKDRSPTRAASQVPASPTDFG